MSTCSKASAEGDPGRYQRPGRGRPHPRHPTMSPPPASCTRPTTGFLVAPTVLAETCYLLHEFGGPAPEVAFLRSIAAGELELAVLTVADVARMAELAERYGRPGPGRHRCLAGGLGRTPGPDHPGDLRPPALHRRASRTHPELSPCCPPDPVPASTWRQESPWQTGASRPHVSIGRPSAALGSRAIAQQPVCTRPLAPLALLPRQPDVPFRAQLQDRWRTTCPGGRPSATSRNSRIHTATPAHLRCLCCRGPNTRGLAIE